MNMKHFYRTRDRPGNYTNQLILKERREKLKQVKRIIAVLLALTVIMLAACSDFGTAVKAAEIGGGNDVNLDCYGEYISNDELGELISYGGYISKSEYARHIGISTMTRLAHPTLRVLKAAMTQAAIRYTSDALWHGSMSVKPR